MNKKQISQAGIDLQLRRSLSNLFRTHFSELDLKEVVFDLDVRFEDLKGQTPSAIIRELIKYVERRRGLEQLILAGQRQMPSLEWPDVGDKTAVFPTNINTFNLRRVILQSLNDDQTLMSFCQTHFPDIVFDFGTGMSFREKVQALLTRCRQMGKMDELVGAMKTNYAETFELFEVEI